MKRNYILCAVLLLLLACIKGNAQNLPPFQPEQDACHALPLCGGIYSTSYSYTGYGNKLEQSQLLGACFDETNSVWLKIEVATAGNISFVITPILTTNDYDFAVYNITGKTCDSISAATRIRCNGCDINSSPGGLTGCSPAGVGTISGPGPGPAFISSIAAAAGDVYLIMIDNFYQGSQSGFSIDFTTSTATFVGGSPPLYDSIARACSYADSIHVYLNKTIKCTSLQSNGSDFQLIPAAATVASATGRTCTNGNGFTQDLTLRFSNPLPPGTYTLKPAVGTDGNTLLDVCNVPQPLTDSLVFIVSPPVTIELPDTVTCIGNPIQLNATVVGGPYSSLTYSWQPASYLSSTTIANPIASPPVTMNYTVTVVPNGMPACSVSKTMRLEVLQGFNLANHDTSICFGANVQLNAVGDPRYTYTWTPATDLSATNIPNPVSTPNSTITYTVTASKTGCTDSSRSVTIDVQPGPSVYIGPDVTICYGDTLHLNPVINPDTFSGYRYSWSPANVLTATNVRNPVFYGTDTVTLTLEVTTPAGCRGSAQRVINVIPNNFIVISADTGICPGSSVQLQASGGDTYRWVPSIDLDNDTIANPIARPSTSTLYTVYASNNLYGCSDTQQVMVTVFPNAVISLPDTVTIYNGERYSISPGGNGLYFQWFPLAGLNAANISNPIASPTVNTRYYVTARTEPGCMVTDSMVVLVVQESDIAMPNAFSPGSAPNDKFKPVYRGPVTLKYLRIFNRWGTKVFESNDINEGWDGTLSGQPQPMGVYIYLIEAVTGDQRVFRQQGNVTLIR